MRVFVEKEMYLKNSNRKQDKHDFYNYYLKLSSFTASNLIPSNPTFELLWVQMLLPPAASSDVDYQQPCWFVNAIYQ